MIPKRKHKPVRVLYMLAIALGIILLCIHSCEIDMPDPPDKDISNKIKLENPVLQDSSYRSATVLTYVLLHEKQVITEHGHCWSTEPNPTIDLSTKTSNGKYNPDNPQGGFIDVIEDLQPNTKYNIRAYAQYGNSIIYSPVEDFTTIALKAPTVLTITKDAAVTFNTITLGGEVVDNGGTPISARGICYNTSANVSLTNRIGRTENGVGIGEFSGTASDLDPNTTYYFRAYATNNSATGYGDEVTYTTNKPPIPNAEFTADDTFISEGSFVQFTDLSTNEPTEWSWNFGDGSVVSSDTNPSHVYNLAGTYTVTLTVSNSYGSDTKTKTDYIIVAAGETGTLEDIEDNIYNTVKIGNQWWMAENLKTTKHNDGTDIPLVTENSEWSNLTTPGYCLYDNNAVSGETYGALYNWYTVETGKLCPTGWHVPTGAEWTELIEYLGGASIAGGKLKEKGTMHWASPNTGATNESGFTALPGGECGDDGIFYSIGYRGRWWSATTVLYINLDNNTQDVWSHNDNYLPGRSIRCVKD